MHLGMTPPGCGPSISVKTSLTACMCASQSVKDEWRKGNGGGERIVVKGEFTGKGETGRKKLKEMKLALLVFKVVRSVCKLRTENFFKCVHVAFSPAFLHLIFVFFFHDQSKDKPKTAV